MTRVAYVLAHGLAWMLLLSVDVSAQSIDDPLRPDNSSVLKQQGKLFTIQIVPGEPIRFFVVGKEEAKLDLSKLAVTVRRVEPYPGKILSLDRQNDYFVSENSSELKDATAIEVTAKIKAKAETIRFQLDNKKP